MRLIEHIRFSSHGFSPKRTAYVLVLISAVLLGFHSIADYRGDEYLTAVAFVLMLAAFVLGFYVSRSDKRRFEPAMLGFVVLVIHMFFQKL
ncbi:MAG: hypothetical protein P4N60_13720 [Verrucomicrobiae bacterium]|nr:hypothetical protein [Verrucomicrobiae bacterium]